MTPFFAHEKFCTVLENEVKVPIPLDYTNVFHVILFLFPRSVERCATQFDTAFRASTRKEHLMQICQLVVDLFLDGESLAQIEKRLLIGRCSLQYIVRKIKRLKLAANLPRQGRKRLTALRQGEIIRARMLEN
jgi:hypothetical protein